MYYIFFFLILGLQELYGSSSGLEIAGELFRDHKLVCSDRHYESAVVTQSENLPDYTNITDFIKDLKKDLNTSLPITRVRLPSCSINDSCLKTLYENFLSKEDTIKNHVRIIDFYCDDFGEESIPLLERMLNELPHLSFVHLSGTSLGEESVRPLLEFLISNNEKREALAKIKKIIFLDSSSIKHKENESFTYDQMQKDGLLPENWVQVHKYFHEIFSRISPDKLLSLNPLSNSELD